MAKLLTPAVIAALVENGFVPTTYPAQEVVFYSKQLQARQMPLMVKHVIDNDYVCGEDTVITEVSPYGAICAVYAEEVEGPFDLDTEEGVELLIDAGFDITVDILAKLLQLESTCP